MNGGGVLTKAGFATKESLLRAMLDRSPKWARRLVLSGYRGSHAHGTYLPPEDPHGTDDVDIFGVYVCSDRYYHGVSGYLNRRDTFTCAGETLDVESHELRKLVHLLCKGNPNVHSHLWLEPEDYFAISRAGRLLLDRRTGFLSQKMLAAFTGYAYAQLARMTKFEKHGYMGQKREQVVREHGYDVKNAAHCLRLLFCGIGLATTGRLTVRLTGDVLDTVLAVKRGQWSFERVQTEARRLFEEYDRTKDLSALPPHVDYDFADETADLVIQAAFEDNR